MVDVLYKGLVRKSFDFLQGVCHNGMKEYVEASWRLVSPLISVKFAPKGLRKYFDEFEAFAKEEKD